MLLKALLISLIASLGVVDARILGESMIGRPIVLGPLVGLVLGDLQTGVIVGGTLELIWMGIIAIGAATPPDVAVGGTLGTAFAILSGSGTEVALALAVPVAMLAQSLGVFVRVLLLYFVHRADDHAAKGNLSGVTRMHLIPVCLLILAMMVPSFLAVYFGVDVVKTVIAAVPEVILKGLQIGGGLLPALGFAMLLQVMMNRQILPFFFIGFTLAVFLHVNVVAAAILGLMAAILYTQLKTAREG